MRLLVYGGNQHGERRRIGVWSDEVGPQAFQDTYGSSMRSVSFGVGILGDSPFLILRKIENSGERAYPLVVLFDPGRETWTRFKWNGAHLLWALFGKSDYPGLKLLTEPESYHTDEHLEKLLSEVDESLPPQSDADPILDPEHLLDLWTGSVYATSPLIAHVDPQLTGFSTRPDLKGLSDLLNRLPSSLRCGRGWLFGGRDRHAESLGAHLVFDDGKLDAPSDSDRQSLVQYQRQGNDLRNALEMFDHGADEASNGLKELLSKPVFEWTDSSGEPLPRLLDDILLLKELDYRQNELVNRSNDVDKLFARINQRLEQEGRLNEEIISAADDYIEQQARELTEQQTIYVLTQEVGRSKPKFKDKELSDLHKDAAYSFFVERKLFPADAVGLMPPSVPFRVYQKLLEAEDQTEKIPEIFRREAELSHSYDTNELPLLLDTAIEHSAGKPNGLRSWSKLFDHPKFGADVQEAVRTKVLQRVNTDYHDSLADYLVLSDDPGGEQLIAFKPAFKEIQPLETLLLFVLEQLNNPREPGLDKAATAWLSKLARSELRLEISLPGKDHIADRVKHGWETYIFARRAYRGDPHLAAPSRVADERERKFLAQELAEAIQETKSDQVNFIPELDQLAKLFGSSYLGAMVDALVALSPNLNTGDSVNWVESWLRLAQHKSLDNSQLLACQTKHRNELVRLIVETEKPLKGRDQLKVLGPDELAILFRGLLVQGEVEADHRLRHRLLEVLNNLEVSKDANKPLQNAIDEILSKKTQQELFTRRFMGRQDVISAIRNRLARGDQRDRFNAVFEAKTSQATESVKNRLLAIFLSGERGPTIFDFIGRLEVDAKKSGDDVFRTALANAFEELTSDGKKTQAFFSGDASSHACFQVYKKSLTRPAEKKLLTQLYQEKMERDRIDTIEQSVLQGSADRDKELRKKLVSVLDDYQNDATRETLNRVMKQALSSEQSFVTLVRRFVPVGSRRMFGHEVLEVKHDKLLNTLFDSLSPEVGREFLRGLWKHYNAEHGDDNPIMHAAREAVKKLEHNKSSTKKQGSRKKSAESGFYLISFEDSLIKFLAHHPTLRRQAVELEFGTDRVESVESLICDYDPNAQNEEEIQVVRPPTKSWGDRFIGLFVIRDDSKR